MNHKVAYVHFGNAVELLGQLGRNRRLILITQKNIMRLWNKNFFDKVGGEIIIMGEGEVHKTLAEYERLVSELLYRGVDRSALIVGVGGGVVSDMVGFLATSFMRGVSFGLVSTTLLGQVDASIGGKNGVNVGGYKNMVGTFSLPEFVIIDREFLGTLPARQYNAAWGEVLKYALLMGEDLLLSEDFVQRCIEYKLRVVEADFKDTGQRRVLNLGHTYAHAIEKLTSRYEHGEAVALGLVLMARESVKLGLLDVGVLSKIEKWVIEAGLPSELPPEVSLMALREAMQSDKKRSGGKLTVILLEGITCPIIHVL